MRRLVLLALLAAGCGGAVDERPAATPTIDMSQYGPRHAVAGKTPQAPVFKPVISPAIDRQLRAGAIGVVQVGGVVGVRPRALATSADGGLDGLVWSSWTATGAEGRGEFHVLDCQPDCATGHTRRVAATVELSGVKTCDGRQYFGAAEVTLSEGAPPASYVRAPC